MQKEYKLKKARVFQLHLQERHGFFKRRFRFVHSKDERGAQSRIFGFEKGRRQRPAQQGKTTDARKRPSYDTRDNPRVQHNIRGEKHSLRQEKQRHCRFDEVAPQKGRTFGPFLMIMKTLARILIGFYKRFISINLTRPCIYVPTCSIYTLTAIEKHGFFKGCVMGAKRILRCTPFHEGGYDPVAENYKGNAKWLV